MEESGRWEPDAALIFTVRTRVLPISELSGPDRAWVVAALTVAGWTVAAIAERLRCSLRLVQQIKSEPMTALALYALGLQRQLTEERGLRRVEGLIAAGEIAEGHTERARLVRQRDALLDELVRRDKDAAHARYEHARMPGL